MVTTRVKLGTAVALAFTRSPLETACTALELDLISGGRLVLGLGPTLRFLNEDWHGVPYGKPIPHLRETVEAVRLMIRQGHTGALGKWEGEYYKLNLAGFKTLTPPVRSDIPIYLPALYEGAVRLAGEIADGLVGHPTWCESWITDRVVSNLAKGLAKAGRPRQSFDLNLFLTVALGPDKRQCIEDARRYLASYAVFAQYERYFTEIGFGAEARAICQAARAQDERAMLQACTDAMVEHIVLVGSVDEVRARVERLATVADSLTLYAPLRGLSPEQIGEYNRRIADAFYQ
jgi:alkanesulfonate monooxygenase SsuD/methylene tetrahydromethanopterin reductase-like flavin-dependent oxidoreductase (luciferase family)